MPLNEDVIQKIFKRIEERQDDFVKMLAAIVAIPSVSAEAERRGECVKMSEWAQSVRFLFFSL